MTDQDAQARPDPPAQAPNLLMELRAYLDALTITSDNIGSIRHSLFFPWDSHWNGWVRDETAARENRKGRGAAAMPAQTPTPREALIAKMEAIIGEASAFSEHDAQTCDAFQRIVTLAQEVLAALVDASPAGQERTMTVGWSDLKQAQRAVCSLYCLAALPASPPQQEQEKE
jgi:hypothetical protein